MKNKMSITTALLGFSFISIFSGSSRYFLFPKEKMLIQACHNADFQAVNLLLEMGADVNCQDEDGKTPIMIAIAGEIESKYDNKTEKVFKYRIICELLMGKNQGVNIQEKDGHTLLHCFSCQGDEQAVLKLLEMGANPNIKSNAGVTPFMIAGTKSMMQLLIDHGADVNAIDNKKKNALLKTISAGICCSTDYDGSQEIEFDSDRINGLLELGCSLKQIDYKGRNALMIACKKRVLPVVELCIQRRFNIDFQDKNGFTALMHAITHSGDALPGIFVREEIINYLIKHGADLDLKDKEGKTALMHAVGWVWTWVYYYPESKRKNFANMYQRLISNTQNINARDNQGHTALAIAKERYGNYRKDCNDGQEAELKKIIDLLIAHGATE